MKRLRFALITAGACAGIGVAPAVGQTDTVMTTPANRYPANFLHRWFLGDLNRDLWDATVSAPILDLKTFAGGLTPLRRGGGLQTQSLRLEGADGQIYNFRSIDKDATRTLDPALREALPARVLQDQVGALFPLSAMVVAPLLRAGDVLYSDPTLVVMPDDPALGEFQETFAGLLGWIEIRPDEGPDGQPGFAGSTRITGSPRLLERLEESSGHWVNAESYLRARLMDIYVGDWDRHPDQWRWAGFADNQGVRWEPIPRDRDWALARLDGLFVFAAGRIFPNYRGFGPDYHPVFSSTFTGRALDRRILPSLGRESFVATTQELQTALSDSVIRSAIDRLPVAYQERRGEQLLEALLRRRDDLHLVAEEFYLLLAGWTDIYGTDEEDLALVEHMESGHLRVRLFSLVAGDDAIQSQTLRTPPRYDRVFSPDETKEVRVFLHGENDVARVTGANSGILVRVIGGGRDDRLIDDSSGKTAFYDDRGDNEFVTSRGTDIDESEWREPPDQFSATHQAKARDWGSWGLPYPAVSFDSDVGFYVGAAFRRDTYEFRHYPYKSRLTVKGTVGPAVGKVRGSLKWDLPGPFGSRTHISTDGSSKEFERFFGFGNNATQDTDDDFYKFTQDQLGVEILVANSVTDHLQIQIGPRFTFLGAEDNPTDLFIGQAQPYGSGKFKQLGLKAKAILDHRDDPKTARSGWIGEVETLVTPELFSVESGFMTAKASARSYFSHSSIPLQPVLALRVGGAKTWGKTPYREAASLGGRSSLLSRRERRFLGDESFAANAMLSFKLTDFFFLLPGALGVLGLVETGRVWDRGRSPGGWHQGSGGGVWISVVNNTTMVSLTRVSSGKTSGFYFSLGWPF